MEFHLTYEGRLLGGNRKDTRADHKQHIRRVFHHQLKAFWDFHPNLKEWRGLKGEAPTMKSPLRRDVLGGLFERGDYNFVPLVTREWPLWCSMDILYLRPSFPGTVVHAGDIDNRIKTLFDALRIPANTGEMGKKCLPPGEDEKPFYSLLEDDSLISRLSVSTDMLLQPTDADRRDDPHDARLFIKVNIRSYISSWGAFGS